MRTRWSVLTASVLVALAVGVFILRHATQATAGSETIPLDTWRVTMAADGELASSAGVVVTSVPLDFRRQHIFDEHFESPTLSAPMGRKGADRSEVKWRRAAPGASQGFSLSHTFLCQTNVPRPSGAMLRSTRKLDASPVPSASFLAPESRIESNHAEMAAKARALVDHPSSAEDSVPALFEYVSGLRDETPRGRPSALHCLRQGGGDAVSKARLLIALCRSSNIPARLVTGLILEEANNLNLHYWAEAWVDEHWLPMCPKHGHFGVSNFPTNFLVLKLGDDDVIHGHGVKARSEFRVEMISNTGSVPANALQQFWRKASFTMLPPSARHLVRFLLLLPVAALIVSVFRAIIGIPTFGTFSPALLGLAFVDLRSLPWGFMILLATIAVGWGMRRLLDRYHLLLVPRTSVLLTLIVLFLLVVIVVAHNYGVVVSQFVSLFPLVILTHLVERFCMLESEDGTVVSLRTLVGTLTVALSISLALSPEIVGRWLLHYPETLGIVLAAQFLIGRYTGYRVSELIRFRDLLAGKTASGGAA